MEPSDLHESALRRLPEEIASVQSHLQRLDDGVREAAHRLRSSEEGVKASQDQQRALQDGVETALQAIAVLETQKGDLQALAAVKQQHAENAHRRAEELQAGR